MTSTDVVFAVLVAAGGLTFIVTISLAAEKWWRKLGLPSLLLVIVAGIALGLSLITESQNRDNAAVAREISHRYGVTMKKFDGGPDITYQTRTKVCTTVVIKENGRVYLATDGAKCAKLKP